MPRTNDNWERLVAAVIKKQQLWELFHAHSRSPSVLSDASDFSSSISALEQGDVSFSYSIPGGSSPYNYMQQAPINKSKNPAGLVFISYNEPTFDLEDMLRASAEILGRGTFGSVYAAKLDNGTIIGVKRLKLVNISEQDFRKIMGIVGDVKHENVAALRAYYYSTDEKLMIYDYYSGGSVSTLLHGNTGDIHAKMDWKIRIRIAIGAARGISHIHRQNGGKMVHGNIKASNIFLNSEQNAHLSDLCLASMIPTTFPQSSGCYAPEVIKSTKNVSQASDVYSFGILLLELLTRKSPDPSFGHEAVDLVKLVNSLSRRERIKVFDGDLLLDVSTRKQLVRMLEIGVSCVAKSPKKRPKMSAVVKMIEDISMMNRRDHDSVKPVSMNTGNQVSTQTQRKLVFLGSGNPTFDLEDLLRASAEVLGKGTFGTSYRAILENGTITCVKRLRDVIVTNEKFQQHMELTGRMGHGNVAELTAYYYSRDEKLLVYANYHQGSLSATLHGTRYSGKRLLDWNMRLKIAVGAANGIAHIHTENGQKLVHGNIRASNIFFDEMQYGVVSDVGLGQLVSPHPSFVTRSEGYRAPEVTDHMKVTQASDVYSFGVVLLELLSSQPAQTAYKGKAMSLVMFTQTVAREHRFAELLDTELLRYGDVEEEMVEMMHIAMYCVDSVAERRPKMIEIVQMLEKICGTVTARSRLEDLLLS